MGDLPAVGTAFPEGRDLTLTMIVKAGKVVYPRW